MSGHSLAAVAAIVAVLLVIWYVLRNNGHPAVRYIAGLSQTFGIAIGLLFLVIWPFIVQVFYIPSGSMIPTVLEGDRLVVNKFIYRFRQPVRGEVAVFLAPKEASVGDDDPKGPREHEFIKRIGACPGDVVRITAAYVIAGTLEFNHDEVRLALARALGKDENTPLKLTEQGGIFGGQKIDKGQLSAALTGFPHTPVTVHPGVLYLNGKAVDEPYCLEDCADPYPVPNLNREWNYYDNGQPAVKIPSGHYLMLGDNRNDSDDGRSWGLLERRRFTGKAWFVFWPAKRCRTIK
jgi:signal peptidase I